MDDETRELGKQIDAELAWGRVKRSAIQSDENQKCLLEIVNDPWWDENDVPRPRIGEFRPKWFTGPQPVELPPTASTDIAYNPGNDPAYVDPRTTNDDIRCLTRKYIERTFEPMPNPQSWREWFECLKIGFERVNKVISWSEPEPKSFWQKRFGNVSWKTLERWQNKGIVRFKKSGNSQWHFDVSCIPPETGQ